MSDTDNFRIPELDGLRGIAIGMVVLFHYFFLTLGPSPGTPLAYVLVPGRLTWTGVDLFFVLSGFLIGGILIDARGSSNYFKVFYARRFFRILPLYAVWFCCEQLMFLAIHRGIVIGSHWFVEGRLPPYPYAIFLQNFWMASANTLGGLSGGTWTLAVEEQFYLLIPIVIWFVDVQKRPWILLAGIVTAPLLRIALFTGFPQHPFAPFVLMPCRADALLLGVLGAVLWRDESWRTKIESNPRPLKLLLGVLLAGAGFFTIHSSPQLGLWMISIGYTWMAALYLTLMLYAITQPRSRLSSSLRWTWLMGLGTIAYGVYLFHPYVRAFVSQLPWPMSSHRIIAQFNGSVIAIALTLLLCHLSFVYFEKPLIRAGHRFKYHRDTMFN
jgi:peptidoglycan/LPS O-acetylase OafA/YrhL